MACRKPPDRLAAVSAGQSSAGAALAASDLKQTIVGHWGTCPGQNFIYTHLNRVIKKDDLDMIYRSGPGHGGNAMVAQDWLDGGYTEV